MADVITAIQSSIPRYNKFVVGDDDDDDDDDDLNFSII